MPPGQSPDVPSKIYLRPFGTFGGSSHRGYKPNLGKGPGQCPLTCPANAITEPAASSLSDCFCLPDFYADVEESTGQLARRGMEGNGVMGSRGLGSKGRESYFSVLPERLHMELLGRLSWMESGPEIAPEPLSSHSSMN